MVFFSFILFRFQIFEATSTSTSEHSKRPQPRLRPHQHRRQRQRRRQGLEGHPRGPEDLEDHHQVQGRTIFEIFLKSVQLNLNFCLVRRRPCSNFQF